MTNSLILYLHGLIGSDTNWKKLINYIYPAKSLTPKLNYLTSIDEQINYLRKKTQTYETDKKICIANSLGCLLALKMADEYDKLILIAPPYKFFEGSAILSTRRIEMLKKELFFDSNAIPKDELNDSINFWLNKYRKRTNIVKLKELKKELLEFNFIESYAKYQKKIHFVLGKEDKLVPVEEFLNMCKKESITTNLSIIDNCAHAVQIEKPLELSKIINCYIKGK